MRCAEVSRRTGETDINISLDLDGQGTSNLDTGMGFFEHMLNLFTTHGQFNLKVECSGDLFVDGHHSVEDIGIALGQAFTKAMGDKVGIKRYGTAFVPMDEALIMVSLDLSGRAFLNYEVLVKAQMIGDYDTELTEEFLLSMQELLCM